MGYEEEENRDPEWVDIPEPSPEDVCASGGHKWYGNDEYGGRCYCGDYRWLDGLQLAINRLNHGKEKSEV